MAPGRSDRGRGGVPLHGPGLQAHPVRVGVDGDAGGALEAGQLLALGRGYVEGVQQGGEEEEHLHPGEHLPEAHPPPDAEGQEVLGFGDLALRVDEPGRVELLRLVPQVGVHVHGVEQRHDLGVLGEYVTVEVDVPGTEEEEVKTVISKCDDSPSSAATVSHPKLQRNSAVILCSENPFFSFQ